MEETINMAEVVEEVKNANEDELKRVMEHWFEETRTGGLKIGARYMSAAIYSVIRKHIVKKDKASLRDYKRMTDEILKIISVQLEQRDEPEAAEEVTNDRTSESNDNTNS